MSSYSNCPLCDPVLLVEIFVPVLSVLFIIMLILIALLILSYYLAYVKKKNDFIKHIYETFGKEEVGKPKEVVVDKAGGWQQGTATAQQNTVKTDAEKKEEELAKEKDDEIPDKGIIDWLPEKAVDELPKIQEVLDYEEKQKQSIKPSEMSEAQKNRKLFEKIADDNKKIKEATETGTLVQLANEQQQLQKIQLQQALNPYVKFCPTCKKEINVGDTFLEIEDKVFHDHCFKCDKCNTVVDGEYTFSIKKKKLVCKKCVDEKKGTKKMKAQDEEKMNLKIAELDNF